MSKRNLLGEAVASIIEVPEGVRDVGEPLTVSLFRGTNEIQAKLVKNVPQSCPVFRQLLWLAVIHEVDEAAGIYDAKVMLYQDIGDLNHLWIREESIQGADGRIDHSETEHKDALDALSGFEASVQVMRDRLMNHAVDAKMAECLDRFGPS